MMQARDRTPVSPFVLVSGPSGAQKACILHALEDVGYEAIDNPPMRMLEPLAHEATGDETRRPPIGVDVGSRGFDPKGLLSLLPRLRAEPDIWPRMVFAWAEPESIQHRFTQTSRRHPLAGKSCILDSISIGHRLTGQLREAADVVIDTTNLPLYRLRNMVEDRFAAAAVRERDRLCVTLMSFAFPAGLPRGADMVFDVRFLANPHYVDGLRYLTGLDVRVAKFIKADSCFASSFARVLDFVAFTLLRFVAEGKRYATVAVRCTGGLHRSVHVVEGLSTMLGRDNWRINRRHREMAGSMWRDRPGTGGVT